MVSAFTVLCLRSTVQEVRLVEEDVEFIAKVNREMAGYLACLEKIK